MEKYFFYCVCEFVVTMFFVNICGSFLYFVNDENEKA